MQLFNLSVLTVFLPTFFFVSVTPGMCMTLALSMGISIGLKRTLFMMYGELLGVGLVAATSAIGVSSIMFRYPYLFSIFKYGGGIYLIYLGFQMWVSRGKMALSIEESSFNVSDKSLAIQGFITAIANPKAWAFAISLLPPFIDKKLALIPQLSILVTLILLMEFLCLIIYATGGNTLRRLLNNSSNVRLLNKIGGSLMIGVGIWLALS